MPDICSVPECPRPRGYGRSLHCEMHYYRIRRHGDPLLVLTTRKPEPLYRAAHARIARARGNASDHHCVDCTGMARHWSYRHTDPDELLSPKGQPYSTDPSHYDPRCAPCHAKFDGTGRNQYA